MAQDRGTRLYTLMLRLELDGGDGRRHGIDRLSPQPQAVFVFVESELS